MGGGKSGKESAYSAAGNHNPFPFIFLRHIFSMVFDEPRPRRLSSSAAFAAEVDVFDPLHPAALLRLFCLSFAVRRPAFSPPPLFRLPVPHTHCGPTRCVAIAGGAAHYTLDPPRPPSLVVLLSSHLGPPSLPFSPFLFIPEHTHARIRTTNTLHEFSFFRSHVHSPFSCLVDLNLVNRFPVLISASFGILLCFFFFSPLSYTSL